MKLHLDGSGCRFTKSGFVTDRLSSVNCKVCQSLPAYIAAIEEEKLAKHEAFLAQVPRAVSEPWHQPYGQVPMVCKGCGKTDQFRRGDRTCMGHYDNWHCAFCGNVESRLTETGMSF